MVGPHFFISFIGLGLLGGIGWFIFSQLSPFLSLAWKIPYLCSYFFTIGSYLCMFCKRLIAVSNPGLSKQFQVVSPPESSHRPSEALQMDQGKEYSLSRSDSQSTVNDSADALIRGDAGGPGDRELPEFHCTRCNTLKTDKPYHCESCDVCIDQYDHHCPWIGKVG